VGLDVSPVRAEALTIERLERWTESGAHWRVVEITDEHVVIDMCACTGEPVERIRSRDAAVLAHIGAARSDLDLE
jgi:hypothetical protein